MHQGTELMVIIVKLAETNMDSFGSDLKKLVAKYLEIAGKNSELETNLDKS